MAQINLGIVGMGMMLDYHFSAFSQLANVSIYGCTREYYGTADQQALQKKSLVEKASKLGIKRYDGFEEMIRDEKITALVIASINAQHFNHIMRAMDKGKHLLVEKPVVTDIAQLAVIMSEATAKNLVIFPGHNFVYRPAVRKAKEILNNGELGKILYASFMSFFKADANHSKGWRATSHLASGGALMDSGHHQVYQALYLMGRPKLIQAYTSKQVLKHMDCEDFAMINAYYDDGAVANIGQGHGSEHGAVISGIRIVGENGSLEITDACRLNGEVVNEDTDYAKSFYHQAEYFVGAMEKYQHPLSDLDAVRDTLHIIHAAYASARMQKVIEL